MAVKRNFAALCGALLGFLLLVGDRHLVTAQDTAQDTAEEVGVPSSSLNILVLVADDQRFDALGVSGNQTIHTPNLDQLAKEGILFQRAYVTTSICMTSRASILTGQYMSRHGIDRFGKPLTPEQIEHSYPGVLRSEGYYSGFVGKYGVGAIRRQDFDVALDYSGRHWMNVGGERVHVTERNARDAVDFLRQRPIDSPFHLSVSFFAPHAEDAAVEQYLPQPWSEKFYADVEVPESTRAEPAFLDALPYFLQDAKNEGRIRYHWRFDTPDKYQQSMINYYRLITEVDEAVGRIVETLKEQQVLDNTLIVYIGDNGYFQADRGLADKWYPYEESIRVPLIVFDPRLPSEQRGLTIDQTVLNIDIAATVIQGAGGTVPVGVQGEDLSGLYLGPDVLKQRANWRKEFFYEHPTITHRERIPSSQGVITSEYKYVYWPEWEYHQLFDRQADPAELVNLASSPDHQELREQFDSKLKHWRQTAR